jgi:hypothetical protein
MQDKLGWFYNKFISKTKATNWKDLYDNSIEKKLKRKFPGFSNLYRFRNNISHGEINKSAKSIVTAQRLRKQAKDLVTKIYEISIKKGYTVPRLVTYEDAIASLNTTRPKEYPIEPAKSILIFQVSPSS